MGHPKRPPEAILAFSGTSRWEAMLSLLFECLASGVTADMQSWGVSRRAGMRAWASSEKIEKLTCMWNSGLL